MQIDVVTVFPAGSTRLGEENHGVGTVLRHLL